MLLFNFKIAHIAGSLNTAAVFLSTLELKVREKNRLKIREDIETTPPEVKTSSLDVADEEQVFFTQVDNDNESEEQTVQQEEQSRRLAKERVAEFPRRTRVSKDSWGLTGTLRRIPQAESKQMHDTSRTSL